jgi:chromate reductase, NAD(P)H dehydrogenase (quinone)
MANIRIGVLVGSIRKDSLNRKLAAAIERLAPQDFEFATLRIDDLPLYNQDEDADPPEQATRLKAGIGQSQGLLIVTPEYNRSITGAMKNALDHGSRPYGKNAWAGKPAGIIGITPGQLGTGLAQQHLRNVLAYLDVPTMGQPEAFLQAKDGFFDADGGIGEGSRKFVQKWVDTWAMFVRRHVE